MYNEYETCPNDIDITNPWDWIHQASLHTIMVLFGLKPACELCTIPNTHGKERIFRHGETHLSGVLQDLKMFQDLGQEIRVEQSSTSFQQQILTQIVHATAQTVQNASLAHAFTTSIQQAVALSIKKNARFGNISVDPTVTDLVTGIGPHCHRF